MYPSNDVITFALAAAAHGHNRDALANWTFYCLHCLMAYRTVGQSSFMTCPTDEQVPRELLQTNPNQLPFNCWLCTVIAARLVALLLSLHALSVPRFCLLAHHFMAQLRLWIGAKLEFNFITTHATNEAHTIS